MLKKLTKGNKSNKLEMEIESVLEQLSAYSPESEQYSEILANLERLYKISENKTSGVSPDTIAMIAGNLLGIALILGYEKTNIITSKALGFVLKGRV